MRTLPFSKRAAISWLMAAATFLGGAGGVAQTPSLSQTADIVLTEADNGKTGIAARGQSILINLRGNPTTGFQWVLTATNSNSIVPTGTNTFTSDDGAGTGQPGTFSFPFQVVEFGLTTLSFVYIQPWNPQNIQRTFTVTIGSGDMPGVPQLAMTLAGSNVVITWPIAFSSGFYLEGTPSLSPPSWSALNALPIPDGFNYKVVLGHSGESLFFRMRQ
jgi:predicted secreted protein